MNSRDFKNKLLKQYPFRTELHAHTMPSSKCSEISPKEMVETYLSKGYNAVVITNHFTPSHFSSDCKEEVIDRYIKDFEDTCKCASNTPLKVFLGAEIRFTENENDYLIYGVDRDILSVCYDYLDKGLAKFRKKVSLPDSVFIQAHPHRDRITECDPTLIDGMETFNMHPGHNPRIGLSVKYAANNHLAITTAGSDFHHPDLGHEATSALRTQRMPESSFDIAEILKKGNYIFEIGENSIVLP